MNLRSEQMIALLSKGVAICSAFPLLVLLPLCYFRLEKIGEQSFLPLSFASAGALFLSILLAASGGTWYRFNKCGWKSKVLFLLACIPFVILVLLMNPEGIGRLR